jgi:hypothetical protein
MPTSRSRLLEMALKGLEADRAKLDEEIAEIRSELGQRPSTTRGGDISGPAGVRKKRTMSAEARRKISEGMKRRYAEMKRLARLNK